jgi:hypothetical protein
VKIGLASGSTIMGWNFLEGFLAVNLWSLLELYLSYKASAVKVYYIALSGSVKINLFSPFSALGHSLTI